jgi:hypothetical protein
VAIGIIGTGASSDMSEKKIASLEIESDENQKCSIPSPAINLVLSWVKIFSILLRRDMDGL